MTRDVDLLRVATALHKAGRGASIMASELEEEFGDTGATFELVVQPEGNATVYGVRVVLPEDGRRPGTSNETRPGAWGG